MAGESSAGMAGNQAALRKAAQDWNRVWAAAGPGAEAGLQGAGDATVAILYGLLSEPYPPASEPGEAPHYRTGDLREGYQAEVEHEGSNVVLRIGTEVEYAPYLEFGTSRMEARPHLRVAITQITDSGELANRVRYEIAQAQTAALAGRSVGLGGFGGLGGGGVLGGLL